jgi:hypothetical protein
MAGKKKLGQILIKLVSCSRTASKQAMAAAAAAAAASIEISVPLLCDLCALQ